MADEAEKNGAAKPEEAPQVQLKVVGQFIRDMSFENIVAQKGISGDVTPDVNVQISLDGKKRPTDNQFEVITKYQITAKNKGSDDTLFIMELDYGGIFHIENVPDEQLHPFLMIEWVPYHIGYLNMPAIPPKAFMRSSPSSESPDTNFTVVPYFDAIS